MAGRGHPRQPGRLGAHRGPQPPARPLEVTCLPDDRSAARNTPAMQPNSTARRDSRPASGADAGVRSPGDRRQLPHPVDAADRARCRRRGDRGGVRGAAQRRWRSDWSAPNAASATPASHSWCRAAPTSTSGCPRCWRPCTARMRSTGRAAGAAIESLSAEALHLALVLVELLPDEPEALGLAALMCLSESRRAARRTAPTVRSCRWTNKTRHRGTRR